MLLISITRNLRGVFYVYFEELHFNFVEFESIWNIYEDSTLFAYMSGHVSSLSGSYMQLSHLAQWAMLAQ